MVEGYAPFEESRAGAEGGFNGGDCGGGGVFFFAFGGGGGMEEGID